VITQHTEEC